MNPSPATFESLGLGPELAAQLAEDGYEHPTPIQSEAIPLLLSGKDLLGQAATGTGKTAAFSLPIVHALSEAQLPERGRHLQVGLRHGGGRQPRRARPDPCPDA